MSKAPPNIANYSNFDYIGKKIIANLRFTNKPLSIRFDNFGFKNPPIVKGSNTF